jgi:hypothetical protein
MSDNMTDQIDHGQVIDLAARTSKGLTIPGELDETGNAVSDEKKTKLRTKSCAFHDEWNYWFTA